MKRNFGDLKTRVDFYIFIPKAGPEPGEDEKEIVYSCSAQVEGVWLKDLEQAKTNNTLNDITLVIRDTRGEFVPDNKHYIAVNAPGYSEKRFNVKSVQPDLQDKRFITVIAGLVT